MATSRIPLPKVLAGFFSRGLMLGLLGSYLVALAFIHIILVIFVSNFAFFDEAARAENPANLALLPFSVPAGLALGCVVGCVWARRTLCGDRWWRIAVAVWTGFIVGGLPTTGILIFAAGYALVIGFLPGLLTGLIWAAFMTGLVLAWNWPLIDPDAFHHMARWCSSALLFIIGPVALIAGWEAPFSRSSVGGIILEFVTADFSGELVIFYVFIGLCSATVAWLLSPWLTRWYIRESQMAASPESPSGSSATVSLDTIHIAKS